MIFCHRNDQVLWHREHRGMVPSNRARVATISGEINIGCPEPSLGSGLPKNSTFSIALILRDLILNAY